MLITADHRRQLEELIDLTARARALQHEHDHPADAPKLQELIDRHKALSSEREAATEAIAELGRETEELTAAIDRQTAQIAKKTAELNAGTGLTSRDLLQLQEEIAAHEQRVAELEETELSSMERLETAEADRVRIDSEIAEVTAKGRTVQTAIRERLAELSAAVDGIDAQARQLKDAIPTEIVRRFDANAAQGGPGAAILLGPNCQACGQEISGMVWDSWLSQDVNEVHSCEECEAVLLRRS